MLKRLSLLAALALVLTACGLPDGTKYLAKEMTSAVQSKAPAVRKDAEAITKSLDSLAATFASVNDKWRADLQESLKQVAEAERLVKEAAELVKKDQSSDKIAIETSLFTAKESLDSAIARVRPMTQRVQAINALRSKLPAELDALARKIKALERIDLDKITQDVAQAVRHYSAKKSTLEGRLRSLKSRKENAEKALVSLKALLEEEPENIDWLAAAESLQLIKDESSQLPAYAKQTSDLCAQLYVSWEDILTDMEIQEGLEVTFYHQLKRIRTTHKPGESEETGEEPEVNEVQKWEKVRENIYKKHERHLGMAIRYKSAGKFDSEAKDKAQPPGYSYVARRGYRNHYGYWNGGYWYWHRHYSYMPGMYWGRSYRRIDSREYDSYSRTRDSGRSWFGGDSSSSSSNAASTTSRFGSNGTATRANYSNTKYTKSGGYSSSRYKRSGGSYKGSKYSSSSSSLSSSNKSSSYSSSSYRSSSSSGSRSSGGK